MARRPPPVHKFKVGQMVDFLPSKTGVPASARYYRIVSVLPSEGGERLYRIKTIAEAFERVARESELLRTTSPLCEKPTMENAMPKGVQRSNREVRKPKKSAAQKAAARPVTVSSAFSVASHKSGKKS